MTEAKTNSSIHKTGLKHPVKAFFRVLFLILAIVVFACVGILFGAFMGIIKNSPDFETISVKPSNFTSIVYDCNGKEIDRLHGSENREYVSLDKIPENLQNAIIAVEDARFYEHDGIDLKSIVRAGYATLSGQDIQGASTITQQLIKNNVTKVTRNTIKTKIQEQYLAVQYEKSLREQLGSKEKAKDYILELYLNTIGLHHGYSGVQVGAMGYYNKDVSQLTLAECAVIASITNNPTLYSPRNNPEKNKERQSKILKNMLEQGYITKAEYEQALAEDVYSSVSNNDTKQNSSSGKVHSYFVDALFEQISKDLQDKYSMSSAEANNIIYNAGLKINSTLDPRIQNIMDKAYLDDSLFPDTKYKFDVTYVVSVENKSTGKQEHSEYHQFVKSKEEADSFVKNKKAEIESGLSPDESIIADRSEIDIQPQSAMVIMDYHNGEVKALAGGRGEKLVNRGLNRATDSARQPGSVFKVLSAFAPAIDTEKFNPGTIIVDKPIKIGKYEPKNWYSGYRGNSTIRDGIRDSMNIVAVQTMNEIGVNTCYDYLLNLGFTTLENDDHLSTALGGITNGVTQLEVTAAYGALANKGNYIKPTLYSTVLDHDGNIILENEIEEVSVFKDTTAYIITDMMEDVIKSGTGTAAKFRNSKMPIAGKTGTTQESKDLTFVGYTPYYVSGIWFGYDRYDDVVNNMSNLNQSSHLSIWRYIMEQVHDGLEIKDFEKPDGLTAVTICTESGKLANSNCPARKENFITGTEPSKYCNGNHGTSETTTELTTEDINNPDDLFLPDEVPESVTQEVHKPILDPITQKPILDNNTSTEIKTEQIPEPIPDIEPATETITEQIPSEEEIPVIIDDGPVIDE